MNAALDELKLRSQNLVVYAKTAEKFDVHQLSRKQKPRADADREYKFLVDLVI